jgi:hypothetical protein
MLPQRAAPTISGFSGERRAGVAGFHRYNRGDREVNNIYLMSWWSPGHIAPDLPPLLDA